MNELKFKDDVDLKDVLKSFTETESSYEMDSVFDEFVSVNKATREISQYGYNGLVYRGRMGGRISGGN